MIRKYFKHEPKKPKFIFYFLILSIITYIRLSRGYVYLVAVIDWYFRQVLSWRLSNTLDSEFCVDYGAGITGIGDA